MLSVFSKILTLQDADLQTINSNNINDLLTKHSPHTEDESDIQMNTHNTIINNSNQGKLSPVIITINEIIQKINSMSVQTYLLKCVLYTKIKNTNNNDLANCIYNLFCLQNDL